MLYEFMILMFKDEVAGRNCCPKDGMDYITKLRTTLVNDDCVMKNTDALDNFILDMFGETDELENTELTIHDDYTGIPDTLPEQDIVAEQADNTCQDNSTSASILKISLNNVFTQGRAKMIEMKISEVRLHKQSRIAISCVFSRSE